jgi:hypothetical protein
VGKEGAAVVVGWKMNGMRESIISIVGATHGLFPG